MHPQVGGVLLGGEQLSGALGFAYDIAAERCGLKVRIMHLHPRVEISLCRLVQRGGSLLGAGKRQGAERRKEQYILNSVHILYLSPAGASCRNRADMVSMYSAAIEASGMSSGMKILPPEACS